MVLYNTEVVIIGGGIAGIKAAQDLNEKGVKFELLEGRDRIGGRLLSIDLNSNEEMKVDVGASWFHDTLSNELFDEVVEDGSYKLYYDDSDPIYITEQGLVDDRKLKLQQVANEMVKFIELDYFENLDQKDVSLHSKTLDYCFKQRKLLTDDQIRYSPQIVRYLELWHGISWNSMSSKYAMVDNVGRNCMIVSGYSSLVTRLVKGIPSENIHLSTVVTKIQRPLNSKNKIIITTINGDEYHCDYCIVTVPQSILQLDHRQEAGILWEPLLPTRLTDALDMMHFGSLGKFVFEFDELFWEGESTDRFISLGSLDSEMLKQIKCGVKPQIPDFIPESDKLPKSWDFPILILNLYTSYKIPVLMAFTQGELTQHLEQNVDKAWDYMKPIMSKLSNLEKGSEIPLPRKVTGSSWTIDPFSRGSYAACYPGDDPTNLIIQLSKGLGNVRFAGEHTILDGAGAVHGAWMSGRREAKQVLIKMGLIKGESDEYF